MSKEITHPYNDPRPPKVVFALQSPTLLNILAKSTRWRMSYSELGDWAGLAEVSLLDTPKWDGIADDVFAVFVCTPGQRQVAIETFPKAKIVWVAHNGRKEILALPELKCEYYLTFSNRIKHMVKGHVPLAKVSAIIPHYNPQPKWHWAPNKSWSLQNRPSTRPAIYQDLMDQILHPAEITDHLTYGQDQTLGFATPEIKTELTANSSCYLSVLPEYAGFGLAQHEAMASGVPLVALEWGDFNKESPHVFGIAKTPQAVTTFLVRARQSKSVAQAMSTSALDFISSRRKLSRMNDGITNLLDSLSSA